MRSRLLALLCCCLVPVSILLVLPACDDEDAARSRISIVRIAEPGDTDDLSATPLQCDVRDIGPDDEPFTDDDTVVEDVLMITVQNRSASSAFPVDPNGPFGSVVITGYRIDYHADGESIEPLEGSLQLVVPSGGEALAAIVVVSAATKARPPLSTLAQTRGEILGSATITLFGHEATSEDDVSAQGSIQIHFADWI